jgi:hypothetical protein
LGLSGLIVATGCGAPTRPATPVTGQEVDAAAQACTDGDARACEATCFAGQTPACLEAGRMYELGRNVPRDAKAAAAFYRKACDLGDMAGCYDAGYMLETGAAGRRDPHCALALYAMACNSGHARACMFGGFMLKAGVDVERDVPRALGLFQKACDVGTQAGCAQVRELTPKPVETTAPAAQP